MVWAPPTAGVYFFFNDTATTEIYTLSLPDALPISALKLPPPSGTLLAPQLTVPPGAVADSSVLSVTVAVQLLGLPTGTVSGVQLTTVLVACLFTATVVVPELPVWVVSPP